ncbi:MAG: PAS domain-containing protein, partial [Candidatus Eremiobacteraeota bacterium]|nr:PAS domain-containing protein [Candidatus Eremiobacteraeota bacterium]
RPQPLEVFGRIFLMLIASSIFTTLMGALQRRDQRQRRKFRDLFVNASDAILIVDEGNLVQEMNPRAEKLLGYPTPVPLYRLGQLDLGQPLSETSVRRLDGSTLPVAVSVSRLQNETMLRLSDLTELRADQARRLAWRALEVQEEERRRLARELHDGIAQGLYSLRLVSNQGQPIEELLTGLMEEVDQLAKSLWPPVLERLGLGMALQTVLGKVARVECENIRLEPVREAALFRIAQEAVSNALRHGQAQHVKIRLFQPGEEIHLLIQDDGKGFNPQVESQGLGLLSMRERAQLAQGRLGIQSSPRGTTVEVILK